MFDHITLWEESSITNMLDLFFSIKERADKGELNALDVENFALLITDVKYWNQQERTVTDD
jgi:hypothetical protein